MVVTRVLRATAAVLLRTTDVREWRRCRGLEMGCREQRAMEIELIARSRWRRGCASRSVKAAAGRFRTVGVVNRTQVLDLTWPLAVKQDQRPKAKSQAKDEGQKEA